MRFLFATPPIVLLAAMTVFAAEPDLMPLPAEYRLGSGNLSIDEGFRVVLTGYTSPRLEAAASRLIARLSAQTGMPLERTPAADPAMATLVLHCDHAGKPVQVVGEDESYRLTVDPHRAEIDAPEPLGILRGIETFLQLVVEGPGGFTAPAIQVNDHPRFPWRGLMIDVSRHWMPPAVIERNLDAMAAVKLNVLHWHLSDDQGFRVESKLFPKLQQLGSDGNYYTQQQVRDIIQYARDRGIRVVPEFDMPAHSASWLVGYPELGASGGPYEIARTWGIHDPALDPTKEALYTFLDAFIGEMSQLFPDRYFHIGGDEVNGIAWNQSPSIQEFMRAHGLKDNHELQRYFNRRLEAILTKHGKRMEGWDEILDPDLPKDIVIQSWRGDQSLADAVAQGYSGILSSGYYLDLLDPAARHYVVDPLGPKTESLTDEQRARILGGEACMWSEYATPENIDGRIWPRMAAIAERLWSPRTVTDVDSMYRRLAFVDRRLQWLGIRDRDDYYAMLQRMVGNDPIGSLLTLADVVQPVQGYKRARARHYSSFTPLNRLVDVARPDSEAAREFEAAIQAKNWASARIALTVWKNNDARLKPILASHFLLNEIEPVSATLSAVASIGLQALDDLEAGKSGSAVWTQQSRAALEDAKKSQAELTIAIVPGVEELVAAASSPGVARAQAVRRP
jgi:hexosaminidase